MKKRRLLKLISLATIIALLLTLVIPAGFSIYAEDDPSQTVITEESSEDSTEESQESVEDPAEKAPDAGQKAPLLGESNGQVASIVRDGETLYYATLAEAVADAQAGETIKMVDDEALSGAVSIHKNVTLDLNGKTISGSFSGGAIVIPFEGTGKPVVTITDTSAAGDGAIRNETGHAVEAYANATLNVAGGNLYGKQKGINAPSSYATINVNGGSVEGGQYGIEVTGGNVNVTDGTIYGAFGGILGGLGSPNPDIKVSGGSISSSNTNESYSGIRIRGGSLEVTGGSVSGGTGILIKSFPWDSYSQISSATISGGTIKGENSSVAIDDEGGLESTFNINGGAFSDDIGNGDAFTRPAYMILADVDEDGWYELKYDGVVAIIERGSETLYYETLAAAVEAANADETIKMVGDETLTSSVSIKKNLKLDLNGQTISANFGGAAIVIPWGEGATTNKEVTITDTSDASNGAISNGTGYAVEAQANATLNVAGGNLYGYQGGINGPSSYATINVRGGAVEGYQSGINVTGGDVTVTGGTIHGDLGGIIGGLGSPAPNIKVSGGDISASDASEGYRGVYLRGGSLEVTGGTISGGTGVYVSSFPWGSSSQTSSATISGGEISGKSRSVAISDSGELVSEFAIEGGAFSDDIGNGDAYTRPANKYLKLGESDNLYRLADVDKTALQEAVDEAVDPEDVTVSENGEDVPSGSKWAATDADKEAYSEALEAAKAVLKDPKVLQSDVDNALKALQEAAEKIKDGKLMTITYDLNGGTLEGKTGKVEIQCIAGTEITLPEPERSGYIFKYWQGSTYYAGDTYTVEENHTFTAIWEQEGSGAAGGGDSDSKTGDSSNAATWLLLMLLSGAAIGGVIGTAAIKKKRAKR